MQGQFCQADILVGLPEKYECLNEYVKTSKSMIIFSDTSCAILAVFSHMSIFIFS